MNQSSKFTQIAIISYDFIEDSKNSRPLMVYETLKEGTYPMDVVVYCANFSHHKKQFVEFYNRDFQAVSVPHYSRNISLRRIFSYWIFCAKIIFKQDLKHTQLIYFCVPPNELAIVALLYKFLWKKTVILDVVDLWPEAFPLPSLINPGVKFFLHLTARPIRNWLFSQADLVISQSAYFKSKLALPLSKCKVVLMGTTHPIDNRFRNFHRSSLQDCIYILYLGSINAINDLKSLISILVELRQFRKVHLSVIGGGKRLNYLKEALESLQISSEFYGICFDHKIKDQEFKRCHFGYNGYVPSTEVAISYKSLEYLAHGLPLLNSTKGDTAQLVEKTGCGFNFQHQDWTNLLTGILELTDESYFAMQQRSLTAFEENFSWNVFRNNLTDALHSLEQKTPAKRF
jgi:glycosyltransferase involved in cell wall biosynthesis